MIKNEFYSLIAELWFSEHSYYADAYRNFVTLPKFGFQVDKNLAGSQIAICNLFALADLTKVVLYIHTKRKNQSATLSSRNNSWN